MTHGPQQYRYNGYNLTMLIKVRMIDHFSNNPVGEPFKSSLHIQFKPVHSQQHIIQLFAGEDFIIENII
jgi:hypothetical protein